MFNISVHNKRPRIAAYNSEFSTAEHSLIENRNWTENFLLQRCFHLEQYEPNTETMRNYCKNFYINRNSNAPINLKPAGGGEAGHGVGIWLLLVALGWVFWLILSFGGRGYLNVGIKLNNDLNERDWDRNNFSRITCALYVLESSWCPHNQSLRSNWLAVRSQQAA